MATILLIDDDERLRRTLGRMLATEGHEVVEAENGNAALAILSACQPQIVITDVFMPEKDGIELVKELREQFPDIKILGMTGGGREPRFYSLIETFLVAGVLRKPFEREALLDAVNRLLATP
jgi:DNA-binding NtrC family response regulator